MLLKLEPCTGGQSLRWEMFTSFSQWWEKLNVVIFYFSSPLACDVGNAAQPSHSSCVARDQIVSWLFIVEASGLQAAMSERWFVNVIWCDLQKFCPSGITGVDASGRLFWACSALNCMASNGALSYFDLFNSLWNWASLWFSLFPNHIKPEIKKHAFKWGSNQWNMTKIK